MRNINKVYLYKTNFNPNTFLILKSKVDIFIIIVIIHYRIIESIAL